MNTKDIEQMDLAHCLRIGAAASVVLMTSVSAEATDAVAYFSDNNSDRVFIIDPRNMELIDEIPTTGNQPYPIDQVGGTKVYVTTRNSPSLDVIDYDGVSFTNTGIIPLAHNPRSVTYNAAANLAAVSGTKKALMSIIDVSTDTVIGTVGNPEELAPSDFGGSLATGHPFWVDEDQFLLLDRARRTVHLYRVRQRASGEWVIRRLHTLQTPTSVHHFSKIPNAMNYLQERTFYGMAEGAPNDGIPPSVVRILVTANRIHQTGNGELAHSDVSAMGSHHLGMHPDGIHIYAGSNEGIVHIIDRRSMLTVNTIDAGANAGHTTFDATSGVAVQTNHRDDFMSLMDMHTHTLINTVNVAGAPAPSGNLAQSHTTGFDPSNAGFFYTAAAADGNYVEVDAVSGAVTRMLPLDSGNGYIIQGTYNWDLN